MDIQELACCGVKELANIGDDETPEETLQQLYEGIGYYDSFDYTSGRFFVFTQANTRYNKRKYGETLANFIKRNKLGKVTFCGGGKNPSSGNTVRTWVWRISTSAFAKWARKQGFDRKTHEEPYRDNYEPYGW